MTTICCWVPPFIPPQRPIDPNSFLGNIVIVKTSIGGTGTFDFSITPPAGGVSSLSITTDPNSSDGLAIIPSVGAGVYTIVETPNPEFIPAFGTSGTISVTVTPGGVGVALFSNLRLANLTINKISNRFDDTFDFVIAGTGPVINTSITTVGNTGSVGLTGLSPGVYTITELPQPNWVPLTPPGGIAVLTLSPGVTSSITYVNLFQEG